jgi:hypothetical protein
MKTEQKLRKIKLESFAKLVSDCEYILPYIVMNDSGKIIQL